MYIRITFIENNFLHLVSLSFLREAFLSGCLPTAKYINIDATLAALGLVKNAWMITLGHTQRTFTISNSHGTSENVRDSECLR